MCPVKLQNSLLTPAQQSTPEQQTRTTMCPVKFAEQFVDTGTADEDHDVSSQVAEQFVDTGKADEDRDVSSQVAEQFVDTSTAVDTGTAV